MVSVFVTVRPADKSYILRTYTFSYVNKQAFISSQLLNCRMRMYYINCYSTNSNSILKCRNKSNPENHFYMEMFHT